MSRLYFHPIYLFSFSSYGAYFIGVIASAVLYGVTCVQVSYYYVGYPSDPWHIKALVFAVFASDTVHQALVTHSAYVYLVSDIGAPAGLLDLVWSLLVEVLFNAITALLVQCFLVMRVYRLSNKSIVITVIVMSSVIAEFREAITQQFPFHRVTHDTLTQFCPSVRISGNCVGVLRSPQSFFAVYVAKSLPLRTFAELQQLKGISSAVNAITAASDVLIAACLCFLLQKSRTGFRRSDTMINRLMLFSLNTGLLTSIFAVASLISISVWPNAFIYIGFYFCVGRLYCNSLLATLNARRIIRATSTDDDVSMSLQGVKKSNLATSQRVRISPLYQKFMELSVWQPMANNISIKIDTTHELVRDDVRDEMQYSASSDVKAMDVV
ncbi:hypothetical protein EDC04DRAFT_2876186 [Pisolithus marmoratus]|nr:hypothetical protein EDC04DRAFT_2876186 [Pisolithus marmoratus]